MSCPGYGPLYREHKMSCIRAGLAVLLIALLALKQTSAAGEKKAQKGRFDVASLPKKNKELTKLSSLQGRQEQRLDGDFAVLFESTFSLEMSLYCTVLLYAICQLHCCERMCTRRKDKPWSAYVELEMVEMG